jgi:hypothetical protein
MPYVSDWMSIPEACAHIASVEGCDTISALKQLRSALRDGKIRTDRQWKTGEQVKVLRRDVLKIWSGADGEASKRTGRRPNRIWQDMKKEAMQWLDDNGSPEPGDGGQASLEKHIADRLSQRGHYFAESTIRSHIVDWIAEFQRALG